MHIILKMSTKLVVDSQPALSTKHFKLILFINQAFYPFSYLVEVRRQQFDLRGSVKSFKIITRGV